MLILLPGMFQQIFLDQGFYMLLRYNVILCFHLYHHFWLLFNIRFFVQLFFLHIFLCLKTNTKVKRCRTSTVHFLRKRNLTWPFADVSKLVLSCVVKHFKWDEFRSVLIHQLQKSQFGLFSMNENISALTASYTRCLPPPWRNHWAIFNEKCIKWVW